MTKEEKQKPEFVLPKTKFTRKEYKSVETGKVFGVTLSTGQQAMWIVKQPFRGVDFARLVKRKLGPFMAAAPCEAAPLATEFQRVRARA